MSMSGRSDSVSSGASSGPASGISGSFPLFRATYSDRYSPPHQDAYASSPAHSHYQTPPHSASALSFHSAHSGSSYHSPASHVSSPYASRPHSAYGEQHVEGYPEAEERMHYDQSAVYGGQPEAMGYVDEYEHPVYHQEQQQLYHQSHASVYGDDGMDVDGVASSTGLNVSALRGWVEPSSMPLSSSTSSSSSLSSPHTHPTLAQPHPQLSVRIPSVPSLSRVPSSSGYPSSTRRSLTLTTEPLSPLSASGSMGGIPLSAASSSSSLAGSGMGASASMGLVRTLSDTGGSPTRGSEGVARARARAATVSGFGGL
ncbi:hypothetical protein C8R46DRAFT_1087893 [Mycena filopes]|nr:hypothetical protein C8R46DRAFT_1087893 [Mycena filopes]